VGFVIVWKWVYSILTKLYRSVGKDWRRYDCFAIHSNEILGKSNFFCIWDYLEIVLVEDSALKACLNERNGLITPRKIVGM